MSLLLPQATAWANCHCRLGMTQDTSSGLMWTRPSRSTPVIPISWSWLPKRERPTGNQGRKTLLWCNNEGNIRNLIALCVLVRAGCIGHYLVWISFDHLNISVINNNESLVCKLNLWALITKLIYITSVAEVVIWMKLAGFKILAAFLWLDAWKKPKMSVKHKTLLSGTPCYFWRHKLC